MHPGRSAISAAFFAMTCFACLPAVRAGDAVDTLVVPDGLEVKLWATTPQLYNPTNIDVDARGRIWVAEGVNYRETWKQQHALAHSEGDRIVILEDTDGDGVCDSSKIFAQDKDLVCPLGIAVLGNKVVVSCSPNLIVYEDTDGDDKADKKEIFLTGFGGKDHDHGLHSVTGYLDGKWYFNVGNDGPHEVVDKSGWHLNSGSCYVYGPSGNTGNRKSDDGHVWTGGLSLRVDPDGKHLTALGHNFRNSYEIARDSFGNQWQSDNDDDGNRGCRFSWLMEGANMGYFSADGTRAWGADRRPGQDTITAHWHQDDPGVCPIQDNTGAGGPTGVVVYEGGLLPKQYVGCIFDCDAGRNIVRIHKPIADGAGFKFEKSALIEAKPPATTQAAEKSRWNWFRPSDVAIGTDGAIYVADWYDPGVGGHNIADKEGIGRIFRIAPKGDHTRPPKIDFSTRDGEIAALKSPAVNVRYEAARRFLERHAAAAQPPDSSANDDLKVLLALIARNDPILRARAIWLLARCDEIGARTVARIMNEGDPASRITAFRALRELDRSDMLEQAGRLAYHPDPAVRRECAIALRDVPFGECKDALMVLADGYDGRDRFYLEAFGLACDGKENAVYPLLQKKFGDPDPIKWSAAMSGFAWRLHPPAALDALLARASSTALSPDARRRAVDAIAFVKDPRAADVMAKLADSAPDDVKPLAKWWATNRSTNDWKGYAAVARFAQVASTRPTAATTRRAEDREIILDAERPLRQRQAAAGRLAGEPAGVALMIEMAQDGKFPSDLVDTVAERMTRNPDLGVRALAGQYFPRKNAAGQTLPPIKQLAAMSGDADRGRVVFYGNAAACARCHRFNGEGRDVGPDLTSIRTKYQRPELLDNILNPSANIAFGYEPWIVKVKSGDVYSGFILADGASVVIKESSGEQRTLNKSDIVLRKKQPMSIMPDNIALGLGAQDLADLAEFLLKSPTTQPAK